MNQNGDFITTGIVSLENSERKRIAEIIDLAEYKKDLAINVGVGTYVLEIQLPGFKPYKAEAQDIVDIANKATIAV